MGVDKTFSNVRVLMRRFLRCNQHQTRETLLQRAATCIRPAAGTCSKWVSHPTVQYWSDKLSDRLAVLSKLFANQCNAIAAQRVQRTTQIIHLYRKLYGDKSIIKVLDRLGSYFLRNCKGRPLYFMFGAAFFSWEKERVTDEELTGVIDDMVMVNDIEEHHVNNSHYLSSWEPVIDRDHLKMWRKPIPDSYLYEYKVYGTYYDIPARAFYNAQVDLNYRKQWDRLVISLDVVDKDVDSDSEVVRWVSHYPYPMYARDYVYVRRHKVDTDRQVMIISSRAVDHPSCPTDERFVRVTVYNSQMVIRPHSNFDENGFDYVLTYQDDPQSAFPTLAYNWMASTGVPSFVDKLHHAAKTQYEGSAVGRREKPSADENQNNSYSGVTTQYC